MWTSNNALVPDPDKEDILASKPYDWPFLHLGLRMCGWGDGQIKFYLLGTPVVWWFSSIALVLGTGLVGWFLARMQRQYKDWMPGEWDRWLYVVKIAFGGWFFHFGGYGAAQRGTTGCARGARGVWGACNIELT